MKHWLSPRPIQTVISKFSRAVFKRGCPVFPLPPPLFLVFPGGDSESVDITYRGLRSPPTPFSATPVYPAGGRGYHYPTPPSTGRARAGGCTQSPAEWEKLYIYRKSTIPLYNHIDYPEMNGKLQFPGYERNKIDIWWRSFIQRRLLPFQTEH